MAYSDFKTKKKKPNLPGLPNTSPTGVVAIEAYSKLLPDGPQTVPGAGSVVNKPNTNGMVGGSALPVTITPNAETAYSNAVANATETRDEAIKAAGETRDKSISDAQNAYSNMLSTSAQNAEALARKGLTNSGYSDYLNASAYATKRGNIGQAQAQYDKDVQDAYKKYDDTVQEKQTELNNSYLSLLQGIESGEVSTSVALELAKTQGYTPEQLKSLSSKISAKQKTTESDYNMSVQSGAPVSTAQLQADVVSGNISKDGAGKIINEYIDYQLNNSTDPNAIINAFKQYDQAYAEGLIDLKTYQSKYGKYILDTFNEIKSSDKDSKTKSTELINLMSELGQLYAEKKINKTVYNAIKSNIQSVGNIVTTDVANSNTWDKNERSININGKSYVYGDDLKSTDAEGKGLNKLATGDKNRPPATGTKVKYSGVEYTYNAATYTWVANGHRTDDLGTQLFKIAETKTPVDGTVVAYGGKQYIYTDEYWRDLAESKSNS